MLEEASGSNSSVRALKAEIEEAEDASRDRQELFMLKLRARRRGARGLCWMISRSRLHAQWRFA